MIQVQIWDHGEGFQLGCIPICHLDVLLLVFVLNFEIRIKVLYFG